LPSALIASTFLRRSATSLEAGRPIFALDDLELAVPAVFAVLAFASGSFVLFVSGTVLSSPRHLITYYEPFFLATGPFLRICLSTCGVCFLHSTYFRLMPFIYAIGWETAGRRLAMSAV
jgi:hypothetical protein